MAVAVKSVQIRKEWSVSATSGQSIVVIKMPDANDSRAESADGCRLRSFKRASKIRHPLTKTRVISAILSMSRRRAALSQKLLQ